MGKKTQRAKLKLPGVSLIKPDNTPYWQMRVKFGKMKAKQFSTKIEDEHEAILYAVRKFDKLKAEYESGVCDDDKLFINVAKLVIKDLEKNEKNKSVKSSKNYISLIEAFSNGFFKNIDISEVDQKSIEKYVEWRSGEYGVLSKSTIAKHNIALTKIFEKALDKGISVKFRRKYLVNDGVEGVPRSAILYEDYDPIMDKILEKMIACKGEKLSESYSMLYDIVDFMLFTGVRPGKEIQNIKWENLKIRITDGVPYLSVIVEKSKTKERPAVISYKFISALHSLAKKNPNRKAEDYVFSLSGGGKVSDEYFGRKFSEILQELKIKKKGDNKFTLYSLRHSFISWRAFIEKNDYSLAAQCGTSVQMIEKFYAHLTEEMQQEHYGGIETKKKSEDNSFTSRKKLTKKDKKRINKYYLYLANNCIERGFP